MNNSIPSTSDDKSIDLLETCKSCNEKFEDKTILIHLNKKKSCKSKYSKEELEYIEGWSKERKKQFNISETYEKRLRWRETSCNVTVKFKEIQSNLTLRELFVRANLSLKVKFLLKSSLLK